MPTKRPEDLTEGELQRMAAYKAARYTVGEIADITGLTFANADRLLQSPHLLEKVTKEEAAMAGTKSRILMRWQLHGDAIAQSILDTAMDRDDPKHLDAAKYIVDRLAPPSTHSTGEVDVNVHIAHGVMVEIKDLIRDQKEAREGEVTGSVTLVEGKQALPSVSEEVAVSDAVLVEKTKEERIEEARTTTPGDPRYRPPEGPSE